MPKVNNHPMGENSPNLVTLIFNSKQGVGSKRHTREETGLRSFPTFHHLLFFCSYLAERKWSWQIVQRHTQHLMIAIKNAKNREYVFVVLRLAQLCEKNMSCNNYLLNDVISQRN
jgi:hypothetical protein